jgi:hypothetical protein
MCQVTPVLAYLTISPVRVSVFIHTSAATMSRLDYIFRRWLLDVPGVRYFSVLAAGVPSPPDIPAIRTSCSDVKEFHRGLVCRNAESYEYFLDHPELGHFLFRAMDDTILNVSNLLRLIGKLEQVYDARREFVFRGFLNDEDAKRKWLGGGSGWLISRPLVALHRRAEFSFDVNYRWSWFYQDDTTETIIIRKVFPDAAVWSDPLWCEHCKNCQGSEWQMRNFSMLEVCPDVATYSMNEIVSFHPRGEVEAVIAGMMIGQYPQQVRFYHLNISTSIKVCWEASNRRSAEPTVESLRAQAVHLGLDTPHFSVFPVILTRIRRVY